MEQQNEVLTNEIVASKVVVKKTIPQKQKTTIKLVMWALSHVMEREAMLVKIDEIFKLKDTSIESIIEMVDAVEKSMEYLVMDTELGALRQKEKPRKEKVTGDPDTIIKQLVDMAKEEVKPAKKATADGTETAVKENKPRAKKAAATDGTETVVTEKKPRAKKAAAADGTETAVTEKKPRAKKTDVDYSPERPSPAFLPTPVENLDSDSDENVEANAPETVKAEEDKKKPKPRAKKVAADAAVTVAAEEDKKKPKPRAKKTAVVAVEEGAVTVVEEDKKKPKTKAKAAITVAAVVSEEGSVVEEDKKKPKAKPKAKAKEEVPVVVHEVEESLEEDEYLLLNEVVVEGETYMVDSNQNIYDEFNKIIGKYDNGVVVLNA